MTLGVMPKPGDRVRLKKKTIEDIAAGTHGTVIGFTGRDSTGSIIVAFDEVSGVRYLKRSDLMLPLPSPTPSEIGLRQRQGGSDG